VVKYLVFSLRTRWSLWQILGSFSPHRTGRARRFWQKSKKIKKFTISLTPYFKMTYLFSQCSRCPLWLTFFARGAHIRAYIRRDYVFSLRSCPLPWTSIEQQAMSNQTRSLKIQYDARRPTKGLSPRYPEIPCAWILVFLGSWVPDFLFFRFFCSEFSALSVANFFEFSDLQRNSG